MFIANVKHDCSIERYTHKYVKLSINMQVYTHKHIYLYIHIYPYIHGISVDINVHLH